MLIYASGKQQIEFTDAISFLEDSLEAPRMKFLHCIALQITRPKGEWQATFDLQRQVWLYI